MAGEKRGSLDIGERSELECKKPKIRDLATVFAYSRVICETGTAANCPKFCENSLNISQITNDTVTINSDAYQSGKMRIGASRVVVAPALVELDLNAKVGNACNLAFNNNLACVKDTNNLAKKFSSSIKHGTFRPSKNYKQSKVGDASECGSTCGPLEEKDAMEVWNEMKQNGFMSTSHGGVPIPKPRARKNKADGIRKKMEIARREELDRFMNIAAPSGLLNELNPGIINHVRNRMQVRSIIEALVRSDKNGRSCEAETKHDENEMKNEKRESTDAEVQENSSRSRLNRCSNLDEHGFPYLLSRSRQTSNCSTKSWHLWRENDSSMVEKRIWDKNNPLFYTNLQNENLRAIKPSSSANMASENIGSSLCNEESVNLTYVSSLSFKAASVASQWLELLHIDVKGRLAALRRSKKRVREVIQTELPFLVHAEFSSHQEKYPCVNSDSGTLGNTTADIHKSRWSALFNQMEKVLAEEEKQLDIWLNHLQKMQLQCSRGLLPCNGAPGMQQLHGCSQEKNGNDFERDLAVRAVAAAFYSTCNFLQTNENLPSF